MTTDNDQTLDAPDNPLTIDQPEVNLAEQPTAELDVLQLTGRVFKMTRQIYENTSAIAEGLKKSLPESFLQMSTNFAILAKQVANNDAKRIAAIAELRAQLSGQLGELAESLQTEMVDKAVERVLLTAVADAIDDIEVVLRSPDDDAAAARDALRLVRNKLLRSFQPLGVEQLLIVVGETLFDEQLHDAKGVSTEADDFPNAPPGVVTRVYKHGYTINGHLLRRAQIIVRGEAT